MRANYLVLSFFERRSADSGSNQLRRKTNEKNVQLEYFSWPYGHQTAGALSFHPPFFPSVILPFLPRLSSCALSAAPIEWCPLDLCGYLR